MYEDQLEPLFKRKIKQRPSAFLKQSKEAKGWEERFGRFQTILHHPSPNKQQKKDSRGLRERDEKDWKAPHANKPVSAHQHLQQPRPQPGAGPSSQPLAHPRPIPAQKSTLVGAVSSQSMQSVSNQGIPARPPSRCSSEGWTNKSTIRSESALGAGGHCTSRYGVNIESQRGSMGPPMSATAHRVNRHSGSFQFPRDAPQDLRLRAWARWLVKTADPMDLADALTMSCSEQDLERRFNALHGNLDGVDVADDEE
ncbi:hypothetical protein BJ912DRAFT_923354 [Pholiota molesta]|nr:hypothetical protein BJ912DRAFT_923354 [Pholiota molesta]